MTSIKASDADDGTRQMQARVAGLLYLVIIGLGVWGEGIVRAGILVDGDATATTANLLVSEGLFRAAMAADAVMALCDVALAALLFILLRPVSLTLALLAMLFRLIQTGIIGANLMNLDAALTFAHLSVVDAAPASLVLAALQTHSHGYDFGLIFFGINSLLMAWLLFASGFIPRFIGVLIGGAGLVYLAGSAAVVLAPAISTLVEPAYVLPLVAETTLCLWLLIRGVHPSGEPPAGMRYAGVQR